MGEVPPGWSAVRSSAGQDFNQFPVPGRAECRVVGSVRPAILLFLNELLAPHCSGKILKIVRLCSTGTLLIQATPFMDREISLQTSLVFDYWAESEVQLYLTWSVMHPAVAGLFRVNAH